MVARAQEIGLDAVVFTEHNLHWPQDEVDEVQAAYPDVRLYVATELTSSDGDDYLVYGLTDRSSVGAGMEASEILQIAHGQGASVVLAHPYRYRDCVPDEVYNYGVDAVEIMSTNIYNYSHTRAVDLALQLGLPTTAASDGHHVDMLGLYALEVDALPRDEHDLAALIRSGMPSLWIDVDAIRLQNEALIAELPAIRRHIASGLDNRTLRERLESYVNLTVIQGVRDGRDVLRPWRIPEQLAERG